MEHFLEKLELPKKKKMNRLVLDYIAIIMANREHRLMLIEFILKE
jgi:hypothetical protein